MLHKRDRPAYRDLNHWREYQRFFPSLLHCDGEDAPTEQWWTWRGMHIHLDRFSAPDAPAKFLLLHGAGGYGRMLAPYARLGRVAGMECLAPDLPGYGLTKTHGRPVTYGDWVDCVCDLIEHERSQGDRPIVLLGASMGGMLAYAAAARSGSKNVAGIIVTCLLDPRRSEVRRGVARMPALAPLARPVLNALPRMANGHRVPIRWLVNMSAIANHPELTALVCADPLGGGTRVQVGFLRTYLNSVPPLEPEEFTACPVVLAHPAADRWTRPQLSIPFFDRLSCDKRLILLRDGGHMPIERRSLAILQDCTQSFLQDYVLADDPEEPGQRSAPWQALS